ncbi:MAG: hypothetical protein ACXVCO_06000 [Ktedonobacterales bacterium]
MRRGRGREAAGGRALGGFIGEASPCVVMGMGRCCPRRMTEARARLAPVRRSSPTRLPVLVPARDRVLGRAGGGGADGTGDMGERFLGRSQASHAGVDVPRRELARGGAYVVYGARTRPGVALVVLVRFCCGMACCISYGQ